MFPFHPSQDLFAISSDLEQPQPDHDHPITLTNPQDLVHTADNYHVHPQEHAYDPRAVVGFSLSSHRQEMLGGHDQQHHQLSPNYPLTIPFTSGQQSHTADNSSKGRDVDGDEEEKKKKKALHREIERQRRKEMNTLYTSLRSLLPAQFLKGKRAVSDQLNAALDYINQLQRSIKQLESKRARLKSICKELMTSNDDILLELDTTVTSESYSISVQPYSSGIEVVVHSGHHTEQSVPLSRVIKVLLNEGMDIVCCATTKVNDAIVHTIQSEACDSTNLDIPRLQWKLNELLPI